MTTNRQPKVRFALVGCGAIARKHVIALRRIDQSEIVGVFDTDPVIATEFARRNALTAYPTVDEMIDASDPDFLNILTPSGSHAQNVLELMRFNRHFVVEKPLALRVDEIDAVLEQCANRNREIHVVKQNRFNPPVYQLKQAIEAGRFGKLVLGTVRVRWTRDQAYYDQKEWRGTWAEDGGVLTNQASHHIDALLWMMGEPQSVVAKISRRLVDIEAEDTGVAIVSFRNGALGIVEATTATRPRDLEGSISVLGERGSVEVGGFFMNQLKTWNFSEETEADTTVWEQHAKVPDEPAWNHTEFFKDVIDSHLNGRAGLVSGLEGRKSVELINAIYESAERGEEVFLRYSPKECRLGVRA